MRSDLEDVVAAIVREAAAEVIMPRFRKLRLGEIEEKAPGEIVTTADRLAEAMMTPRLRALIPGSRVVGEEAAPTWMGNVYALPGPRRHLIVVREQCSRASCRRLSLRPCVRTRGVSVRSCPVLAVRASTIPGLRQESRTSCCSGGFCPGTTRKEHCSSKRPEAVSHASMVRPIGPPTKVRACWQPATGKSGATFVAPWYDRLRLGV